MCTTADKSGKITGENPPPEQLDPEADCADHVNVNVRDSEEEFMDDEANEGGDVPYDQDSGSESKADDQESLISGSEVIIRQPMGPPPEQIQEDDMKTLTSHPAFHSYVQSLVNEKVQLALKDGSRTGMPGRSNKLSVKKVIRNPKSPSDTTIYAPALNLTPEWPDRNPDQQDPNVVVQKISDFVAGIRLQQEKGHDVGRNRTMSVATGDQLNIVAHGKSTVGGGDCKYVDDGAVAGKSSDPTPNWIDQARDTAQKLVADAERNKARPEMSQGGPRNYSDRVDDDFFHITCHVDSTLRAKIEAGQYVDLEKLLIKDKPFSRGNTDNRMGLFTKDGLTYFAPASDRDVKINRV